MKTPYECYVTFAALKMHFSTESYDYFKYNGKVKTSVQSFQKRHDKYHYNKLTSIFDLEQHLVPMFINNPKLWIANVIETTNVQLANEWLKRKEGRSYFFEEDIKKIDSLKQAVTPKSANELPELLKDYINKTIGIDTLIILNQYINFKEYWNKIYVDNFLYNDIIRNINKTTKFITYDNQNILKIIRKHIKE